MTAGTRRVAVVTGANRGIGREVARQLAGHGFLVIAGARDLDAGERAARELDPAGANVIARRLDVTDPATIADAADWTAEHAGRADVLINNAAIHYDTWQRAQDADLDVVREALDTNLLGAWRTTQAFLPLLRRGAHARIVNVSSEGGSISGMTGGALAYSVSKAALNALTRLLAGERGPTASSSTRSARAGLTRTWARAAGLWPRGRPACCGPRCSRTTGPPAASSGTASPFPGNPQSRPLRPPAPARHPHR